MAQIKRPLKRLFLLAMAGAVAALQFVGLQDVANAALTSQYQPVTVALNGEEPNNNSGGATSISGDGRYVGFLSGASNLVSGDTNGFIDAFRYDRQAGTTTLVSRTATQQSNGNAQGSTLSRDGQHMVYYTEANNLGGTVANGSVSIYQANLAAGVNTLVATGLAFAVSLTVSGDGNLIVYVDDQYNLQLFNVSTGLRTALTTDSYSQLHYAQVVISANGTKLVYMRDTPGPHLDLFLYDITSGQTTQISNNEFPAFAGEAITNDGHYVSYVSLAGFGAHSGKAYIYDTQTGQTSEIATVATPGMSFQGTAISDDGNTVAISQGGSQGYNINLHNRLTGEVTYLCPDQDDFCFISASGSNALSTNGSVLALEHYTSSSQAADFKSFVYTVTPPDTTGPTLGQPIFSVNPKVVNQASVLNVSVSDTQSALGAAEYFIGDIDPGTGHGTAMALTGLSVDGKSATAAATFGASFPTGVYRISVRARDVQNNWSSLSTDYLVVYSPDGPRMTGKRSIVPSLSNGDVLPGLIANGQTDKATFAFSVKYNNQGQINPSSDLQFKYSTGTKCNNPAKAQNCHELNLDATTIAWLTTQDQATGIFQGAASMVVDGVTSQVVFRVTGQDGEQLSPTASDKFQIRIFATGSNPNTASPLYQVNSNDIARGNIKLVSPPPPAS